MIFEFTSKFPSLFLKSVRFTPRSLDDDDISNDSKYIERTVPTQFVAFEVSQIAQFLEEFNEYYSSLCFILRFDF